MTAFFSLMPVHRLAAQNEPTARDSLWQIDMPEVVVTATKGAKALRNVPIPTQVITREDVTAQGATRLSDLLAEQTGLTLVHDHGTGIQLQGLDAAYTLILIDGEPVIGRTAGTLNLERLTVADIERIEIVRGPSSSLYGSEALAGVINLITRKPADGLKGYTEVSYETHDTVDLTASAEIKNERFGARFLLNRYSSEGYDLSPDLIGLTVPGFTDYTTSTLLTFTQSASTEWQVNARFARQTQNSRTGLSLNGNQVVFDEEAVRLDWSLAPQMVHRFSPTTKLTTRLYAARYKTDSVIRDRTDDAEPPPGETHFDQFYRKGEAQLDAVLGARHLFTLGGGYIGEAVVADRVRGGKRTNYDFYSYAQHEWIPADMVDVILSARLDVHSDYAARLSPKAAVLIKPLSTLRLRASAGSGFKAPTFQQLYMDFTNPAAGYSVLGATDIEEAIAEFEALGLIQHFLTDPSTIGAIRPENAVAFNVGLEADPSPRMNVQVNLFRNNVRDLIETLPVATKTNGQHVFTYVNLNRSYTQGLNAEVLVLPLRNVSLTLGYQFLDAKDQDVLDALDAGTIYKRIDGRDRRVRPDEYGGLFNRSRHSGSVRLRYQHPGLGLTASVRGIYRGRYGFGDQNGNLILDDASEYVPGYTLWHATLTKDLSTRFTAQLGVKNLLDTTNPELIPSQPGRLFFARFRLNLNP